MSTKSNSGNPAVRARAQLTELTVADILSEEMCGAHKVKVLATGAVDAHQHADGGISMTFGAGIDVGDLAAALAKMPQDSMIVDLCTGWFCDDDNCQGVDAEDEEHDCFVTTLITAPTICDSCADTGRPC